MLVQYEPRISSVEPPPTSTTSVPSSIAPPPRRVSSASLVAVERARRDPECRLDAAEEVAAVRRVAHGARPDRERLGGSEGPELAPVLAQHRVHPLDGGRQQQPRC